MICSTDTMETIGERLRRIREERGLSQEALAARAGVTQGTVSQQEAMPTRVSKYLPELAKALGVSIDELRYGKLTAAENLAPYDTRAKAVPVISLIRASELSEINCPYEPGDGDRFETPDHKIGPRGWAHVVSGTSMDDGTERGFPEGCLIFCDPDRAPKPNDFVIAKDVNGQRATFKQLVYEDGRWFLRPLNRQFPVIEIDGPELRVIAVVTETRPQSRRLV